MLLEYIRLIRFRNFLDDHFPIGPGLTLIIAENAKGKTSLLEGIYTAVYGTGFRESREKELITWECDRGFVETGFADHASKSLFQIQLQQRTETTIQKTFFVNKAKKPWTKYRALLKQAVLFAPEQIQIVTGSPSRRRRYFDEVLSATDPTYAKLTRGYENAIRQRNKLLENYENEDSLEQEVSFWNELLIEHAAYISQKRQAYCDYLNAHDTVHEARFSIVYTQDMFTKDRLRQIWNKEKLLRRTLIGPHKDDYSILLHTPKIKEVSLYGSRSEQRMAVFWLKLSELTYFEDQSGARPILLLDDIFSELDDHNRAVVMGVIRTYQTVATTTGDSVRDLLDIPATVIRLGSQAHA